MRVTALSPAGPVDVEVDDGLPVARLRWWLARLTGDASWTSGPLTADGVPLDDAHPAGLAPLRHGATLRPGPGPLPGAVRAARAPWHLAVVAGPDTGALLVPDGAVTLGPGGGLAVADDEPWLVLLRPQVRRARAGRAASPASLRVRCTTTPAQPVSPHDADLGATVAHAPVRGTRIHTVLVSRRGRARRIGRWRWRTWRPGEALRAGSSTLVLRLAGGAPRPRRRWRLARWTRLLPAVAGATTSVVLATTMHQPVLLLGALSALVVLGPRGERPSPEPAPDEPCDLAALRIALAGLPAGAALPSPPGMRAPGAGPWRPARDHAEPWEGDLAVVGPRPAALAAARGLVLDALAAEPMVSFVVRSDRPEDWSWLAWLDRPAVGADRGASARLVVLDGGHAGASGGPARRVLRLVAGPPPPWCSAVLEVDGRAALLRGPNGCPRRVPYAGVRAEVADATTRALAAHPAAPGDLRADCPDDVALGDLPGVPPPDPATIAHRWRLASAHAHPTLATAIGSGPGGTPVVVDLVRDGPHTLVAGTTGSGKSELLTTLVLGLALAHPPDRLAVLLVDFKGGTGLPALTRLPHVVGHLSDLDAAGARRTLRGLTAELRRRERVLAGRSARDLGELDPADPGTPPRLLVVVDEFRALADDLPDLVPSLARLAAQGRSLGVHLVLATQRPAGAVPADLRANVALRMVLRVADGADSADLVGVPEAAGFDRPGLALLARGSAHPELVQVARAVPRRARPPVRLAGPWPKRGPGGGWTPTPPGDRTLGDPGRWVAAMRRAAGARPTAVQPWLPPLPTLVAAADVPPGPGLPLALADLPDELSRGPVRWDPDAGHLLVLGGPGSGRTTTLAALASAALADGRAVHAVGLPPEMVPGAASCLAADDVTRAARLVRLLAGTRTSTRPRPLLLLDDVGGVLAGLAWLARGAGADCLDQLWASAGGPVAVAAAGGIGPATQRLAPFFADRLVLGSSDPVADLVAGVPPDLAGPRPAPGRAIHLGRQRPALCQVALPASDEGSPDAPAAGVPDDGTTPRVRPLPARVQARQLPAPRWPAAGEGPVVALGVGGDGAVPVMVDLARPLLVVGPPGSGRTTALATLAAGAGRAGIRVDRPTSVGPPGARAAAVAGRRDGVLLVIDDLDDLEAREPAAADALAALLGSPGPLRLVAATTTAHAVASFRGVVPALVRTRRLLVLDLVEPGAADLLGPEGLWLVDPHHHPPGRGALRLGRDVVPVQVAAPA